MINDLEKICVEAYTPLMSFLRTDTPLYKCNLLKTYCLNPEGWRNCDYYLQKDVINKISLLNND